MFSPTFNKNGNKRIVKRLINKGVFDEHIDELSKALYTKRSFTKDIKYYFNNNIDTINNYLTPTNKNKKLKKSTINKNNNNPINKNNLNYYEFNKEEQFNEETKKLLKLLNDSQEKTNKKFRELKDENDMLNSIYKIYKELINNKNINGINEDNNIFMLLYDLLLKYKSSKNLSFELNSFFSDILKETPLDTNNFEKLKFYYILNGDKYNNINKYNVNVNKKIKKIKPLVNVYNYNNEKNYYKKEIPKEPRIIDLTKINYLKEIKYLNKLNRVMESKIKRNGGKIIGTICNSPMEKIKSVGNKNSNFIDKNNNKKLDEEYEENEGKNDFKNYEEIKKENENKNVKFDIQRHIQDINILKNTIRNSFISNNENKKELKLKTRIINLDNFKNKLILNLKDKNLNIKLNNDDNKNKRILSNENKNKKMKLIYNKSLNNFKPIISRNELRKTTSLENYNHIINRNMKYITNKINNTNNTNFNKSSFSNKNNYPGSTLYSNRTNNNQNKRRFSLNNSINITNKIDSNTPKKKIIFIEDDLLPLNNIKDSKFKEKKRIKILKKSKTVFQDNDKNYLLDNRTENIYSIAKNINVKNTNESIKRIKEYLKFKNSKLPSLYMGNKLKDTISFFHEIKNEIKNNNINKQYQNIRKMLNDKEKKRFNENELVESTIMNKDKELLFKILKNK